MTAADKQEIGLLKNYIASILPNMLDFCFNVVLAVIVYLIGSRIIKAILKMNKRWADRKERQHRTYYRRLGAECHPKFL